MGDLTITDTLGKFMQYQETWESLPVEHKRALIEEFQSRVQELEVSSPADPSITHYLGDRTYGREAFVPKGVAMVGKIYKEGQINVLIKGVVLVATEHSMRIIEAPATYVSEANTKKIGYVIEDMTWLTVMPRDNEVTNPNDILADHTTEDYGD